jgi:alpha-galactosidase
MWAPTRDAAGNLQTNSAFPSGAQALAEYVHARGLKLGLYSDLGVGSCDPHGPGSGGHWPQDAAFMAAAGMDYLYVYAKTRSTQPPPNLTPPPPHTHTHTHTQ